MSTRIFAADEMIKGLNFADEIIEVGPKLPTGFLSCTLERCHLKLHGSSPSIHDSRLIDCTIECTRKMTDRRLPKFFGSDYLRCKFIGQFDGVDFGRDPRPCPVTGAWDEFGDFIECDFSDATLDACRFFNVDITRQKFASWPQFVIPYVNKLQASKLEKEWPGTFGVHMALVPRQNPALVATTGTVSGYRKEYALSLEELEQALATIGGVIR